MVPSRQLAAVRQQAWGGVPAAPQPALVAAQLAAGQTVNVGGTQLSLAGPTIGIGGTSIGGNSSTATLSVGGLNMTLNIPPGMDISSFLAGILGSLTGGGSGGGCRDCG
jgi:hypothetical protein